MSSIKLATKLAAMDPEFAKALLENPKRFKEGFALTDTQIESIIDLGKAGGALDPSKIGPQAAYEA